MDRLDLHHIITEQHVKFYKRVIASSSATMRSSSTILVSSIIAQIYVCHLRNQLCLEHLTLIVTKLAVLSLLI